MVSEALDFNYLLLENYRKLNITEDELATIFMINHLIESGNGLITGDLLSLKMGFEAKKLDLILTNLLKRGYIEFVVKNKKTVTTIEPLKDKLYKEFQDSLSREQKRKSSQSIKGDLSKIYTNYEKLLSRNLCPVEKSKIHEWVSYGYTAELIVEALKEALSKGQKTISSVDKILLSWNARKDIEEEGVSPISNDWRKNLEETIKIAKTPWINDDDETNK